MRIRLVSADELERAIPMPRAVEAMARAFSALSSGEARVPLRIHMEGGGVTTLAMPAYLPEGGGFPEALSVKVVTVSGENRARGLPSVQALVLVFHPQTGVPLALVEGGALTALRTGAASGLATQLMANPNASVLAVFGAGVQARTQVEAIHAVRPLTSLRIVSRGGESARVMARELKDAGCAFRVEAVDSPIEALKGADLVATATDSAVPVFPGEVVEAGTHVNAVGAYTPAMREVDGVLVGRSRVVVDSREGALAEAGDLTGAFEAGEASPSVVVGELGEVVAGRSIVARTSPTDITLFKSVGSGAQDAVIAGLLIQALERGEVGREVEL